MNGRTAVGMKWAALAVLTLLVLEGMVACKSAPKHQYGQKTPRLERRHGLERQVEISVQTFP